ncbi:EamA family transporter [Gammaproteobacteria bacterium 45_16_T64]|nr:EamA family transporter [Gammaproteobacteria bacterium 45_16_T64]
MSDHKSSLISVHISVLILGGTGLFSKLVELPATDIITYRSAIAAISLFAILLITRGTMIIRNAKHLLLMLGLGVLLAIHWVSYFYSMQVSGVAVGMVALFTYPVITVFIEPLFHGEKPKGKDIICGLAVLFGVILIVPEFSTGNSITVGILWGVFSAFFFSTRNVLQKRYLANYGGLTSMLYQSAVAGLITLPFISLPSKEIPIADWVLLFALGTFFTALPHTLFTDSLKYLKAKTVSLIASLQPLYGALFALWILGEQPSISTVVGGLIILSAATYESYSAQSD